MLLNFCPEIPILSKYKEEFSIREIYVLVSDQKVINMCNNKHEINNILQKIVLTYW